VKTLIAQQGITFSDSVAHGDTCSGARQGGGRKLEDFVLSCGVRWRSIRNPNDNGLAALFCKVSRGDNSMRLIFGHLVYHLDKFTSVMVALLGHFMSKASNLVVFPVSHLRKIQTGQASLLKQTYCCTAVSILSSSLKLPFGHDNQRLLVASGELSTCVVM